MISAAQRRALEATRWYGTNTVRASRKVSASAIIACERKGLMTVTRDKDGIIGTLTALGGAREIE